MSDVFSSADAGQVTLLGLLDQSSAFDVVDHDILLKRLHVSFGFTDKVLKWTNSYLSGRTHYVFFNGEISEVVAVRFGVPQGSSTWTNILRSLHI